MQKENQRALRVLDKPVPDDLSWLGEPPVQHSQIPQHLSVVLVVDLSGSMCGEPVEKAAQAAIGFLEKMDLTSSSIALVIFAVETKVQLDFSQNQTILTRQIRAWDELCSESEVGVYTSANPFPKVLQLLKAREGARFVVVLTDGEWSNQEKAIQSASLCHRAEIEVVALGFGDADEDFLRAIATSDENAMFTQLEHLGESFSRIAQALTSSERSSSPGKGLRIWD